MLKNYFFGDGNSHSSQISPSREEGDTFLSLKEFMHFLNENSLICDFESSYFSKTIAPFFTNINSVKSINFTFNDISTEDSEQTDINISSIVKFVKLLPYHIEINFIIYSEKMQCDLIEKLKNSNIKHTIDDTVGIKKTTFQKQKELSDGFSVSIYGSCDSRDIFRVYKETYDELFKIPFYISNVSVSSLFSSSLDFEDSLVKAKSTFLSDCVKSDLRKNTFHNIITSLHNCNSLVLDFMDERFDVIVNNETLITNSWSFRSTVLANSFTKNTFMNFDSDEKLLLTLSALDKLITAASELIEMKNIIINKVYMVDFYYDGNVLIKFDDMKYNIKRFNEFVKKIHDYLEGKYPDLTYLSTPEYLNFCDYRHQWGIHPYHYNNFFYLNRAKSITSVNK